MKLGVLSDTHEDSRRNIPAIIKIFDSKGVDQIIHGGDIIAKHVSAKLFGNLPVDCALTGNQHRMLEFSRPPNHWRFTKPGDRVLFLERELLIYLGHQRFYELLSEDEGSFIKTLNVLRRDYDGLRWLFGGHTHHQILRKNHVVNCVNPGAVENFKGAEYAIVDTDTTDVIFSRIPPESPTKRAIKIGVISDSRHVSGLDPYFWHKLVEQFKLAGVEYVIHCGNIANDDIGRTEFDSFSRVFFSPEKRQGELKRPANWEPIDPIRPVVDIEGYQICVQFSLGEEVIGLSERELYQMSVKLIAKHWADIVLFGVTPDAFLDEIENVVIINPGNVIKGRNFAIIELPKGEYSFSRIQMDPLP